MSGPREVEVKYRVPDPTRLHAALTHQGVVLSTPVEQDDQAYAEPGWSYGMSKIGVAFARLRTEDGHHLFTVKKPVDNELSCLEYESEVADRSQMHHAVITMGFTPTVRIVKQRQSARHGGLSVCLDRVEHVGMFLELERILAADESASRAQTELDRFARNLDTTLERTLETYDSLVRAALASA